MDDLTFEDAHSKEIEVYEFGGKFVLNIYTHEDGVIGAYLQLEQARVLHRKLAEYIEEQSR